MTLPKEIRAELGLDRDDYVIIEKIGKSYFIKKLEVEKDLLEKIRKRVKKRGITRELLESIIEGESKDVWERRKSIH